MKTLAEAMEEKRAEGINPEHYFFGSRVVYQDDDLGPLVGLIRGFWQGMAECNLTLPSGQPAGPDAVETTHLYIAEECKACAGTGREMSKK